MSFEAALRAAGLVPREVVPDGRIRRCKTEAKPGKRNGWYVLHPDGRGAWGDWTTGSGEALGRWQDESAEALRAGADRAKMDEQRRRERDARIRAMRSAREFWQRARPMNGLHPYLGAKALTAHGCSGLRIKGDLLVVPVVHEQWLLSVQTIDTAGRKLFWPGAPVKGGCYVLERARHAVTCICEGLATGLAVYQAVRGARVVVAFDAGNLLPVVQRLRPTGSVVIAADNDWGTEHKRGINPGLDKARNAAELIGCGVAAPEGITGTDWADAAQEWAPRAERRIERAILAAARYVPTG